MRKHVSLAKQSISILFMILSCTMTAFAQYQVGDVVNDFTLGDLEDQPVSLYDFSGKAILLNFFATW